MTKPKPMPDYLTAAKANLNAPDGITLEQYAGRAAAAQAQATIVIAEELRTANLIAMLDHLPSRQGREILQDKIIERLGLS